MDAYEWSEWSGWMGRSDQSMRGPWYGPGIALTLRSPLPAFFTPFRDVGHGSETTATDHVASIYVQNNIRQVVVVIGRIQTHDTRNS